MSHFVLREVWLDVNERRLLCGQAVQFDVNKEADSTGDCLIHIIVKQGEFIVIRILLPLLLSCTLLLKYRNC